MTLPMRWAVHTPTNKPSYNQLLTAIKIIQTEEVTRIGRFHFRRDAHSSLVGRLLLRKCLSEGLGLSNKDILLERDRYNKPVLVGAAPPNPFEFNVSHQGDFVVLTADNVRVGVDVMKLEYSGGRDLAEFFRLMKRQFSDNEWRNIKSPPDDPGKLKLFMRHWTLKESYVKAVGLGLNLELDRIEFETKSNIEFGKITTDTVGKLDGVALSSWTFEEQALDEEHVVAIAREKPISETAAEKFTLLTFAQLIENQDFLREEHEEKFLTEYFFKPEKPGGHRNQADS